MLTKCLTCVICPFVNLKRILSEDEVVELARLAETGAGKALLKVIEFEKERMRLDLETNPMVADGKTDFRFKTGLIEGLKTAAQASSDARLMVEKSEEQRRES